jgi:hypothetical protein
MIEEIRLRGVSNLHPVGTCRMGREVDAVVDPRLRVHGIEGLRVADASIMPEVPGGNTNAPSIIIGEKCAAIVLRTPGQLRPTSHDNSLKTTQPRVQFSPIVSRGTNRPPQGLGTADYWGLALVDRRSIRRDQRVEFAEAVGNGAAVETGGEFADLGVDIVDVADVAVVDFLVVVVSICMILSPGAKVQPKRSTLRSPAGFKAAWSSMFNERAPPPPRFIG